MKTAASNKVFRRLICLVFCFFASVLLASCAGFFVSIFPPRAAQTQNPSSIGLPFKTIQIKTDDGLLLSSWWVLEGKEQPQRRSAVILLHGYQSSKQDLLSVARFLFPSFDVLLIDFRAHGESEGKVTTLGAREVLDAEAAVNTVVGKGYRKIGLYGFSMGAAVALQLAKHPRVNAIVADSPYVNLGDMVGARYRGIPVLHPLLVFFTKLLSRVFLGINPDAISPVSAVRSSSIPVFVLHAENDPLIPVSHAFRLRRALKTNGRSKVRVVNAHGHGTLHFILGDGYEKEVMRFFLSETELH